MRAKKNKREELIGSNNNERPLRTTNHNTPSTKQPMNINTDVKTSATEAKE